MKVMACVAIKLASGTTFPPAAAGSREADMMPNTHRPRGRFLIVLMSLMVSFLAPRPALADEAEISSSSPSASSAASSVVTAVRATDLPVSAAAGPYFSASPAVPGSQHSPAPTLCQISDTVYRADGTPGSLLVALDANGGFNASLAPNTGASPAGTYYKAIFKSDEQKALSDLSELKAHMRWVVGNGNEGKCRNWRSASSAMKPTCSASPGLLPLWPAF